MIQREVKRERLITKYAPKRKNILLDLKNSPSYQEKLLNFKKVYIIFVI